MIYYIFVKHKIDINKYGLFISITKGDIIMDSNELLKLIQNAKSKQNEVMSTEKQENIKPVKKETAKHDNTDKVKTKSERKNIKDKLIEDIYTESNQDLFDDSELIDGITGNKFTVIGLAKISEAIYKSMVSIDKNELRFLVDNYYQTQDYRISIDNQIRSIYIYG